MTRSPTASSMPCSPTTRPAASPARRSSTPASSSSPARSAPSTYVDIPSIVRETIKGIGYDDGAMGFDGQHCAVLTAIDEQSADIAQGVDEALEKRTDAERRRSLRPRGRRRPGNDVRLRDERDGGADADADPDRAHARRPDRQGPQGRRHRLPATRRQDPGHDPLPGRQAGRDRQAPDLDPARPRGRPRDPDQARSLGAGRRPGARRRVRLASTTPLRCATSSSSTRPASS